MEDQPDREHARRPTWWIVAGAGVVVLVLLGLVVVITDGSDAPPTTTSAPAGPAGPSEATSVVTTAAPPSGATTAPATSTTAGSTPTTAPIEPVPVTEGPTFPSAYGRHLVPWSEVDDTWMLVLYDGCSGPGGQEPVVLYLTSPTGARYEIVAFPANTAIPAPPAPDCTQGFGIHLDDWAPMGRVALLSTGCCSLLQLEHLDLTTGTRRPVIELDIPNAGLTRPRGEQIIAQSTSAGAEPVRTLARYALDGSTQVVYDEWGDLRAAQDSWVYAPDGASLVIADRDGIRLVGNGGEPIRDLTAPEGDCQTRRFWDDRTVLVACKTTAADDREAASNLWLVPIDGAAPAPLVEPEPPCLLLCGHSDAWRLGDEVILQRVGGQGGDLDIERLLPDGSVITVPRPEPTTALVASSVTADRIVLRGLPNGVSTTTAPLLAVRPDGSDPVELVPVLTSAGGIGDLLPIGGEGTVF